MNIIIRSAKENDLDNLYRLSQLMVFINLPANKDALKEKIASSIQAFKNPSKNLEDNYYLFVLEDLDQNKIIGASMIHGKHGTKKEPHFYLKVGQENKYSTTINTGFIHGTLNFGVETDGWSEIGGLILDPQYRGHPQRLGKLLSYSRFLYIAFSQLQFTKYIHCELMPPFDREGKSPLWEAIGRKFLNLDYNEADMLSRENKEFILSLYPLDTIYTTLLPADARDAIGKVGKETAPVKKMLEKIGFHYTQEVDPFDGGPHYRALTSEISLIKNSFEKKLSLANPPKNPSPLLINIPNQKEGEFCATQVMGEINGDQLFIEKDAANQLRLGDNQLIKGIFL